MYRGAKASRSRIGKTMVGVGVSEGVAVLPFGCSVRYVPEPNAGGDVQLDHDVAASVTNIRGADMHPSTVNGVSDRVLHRESSPKVGKPIWKYTSIEQFIRALLCVIEGKACEFCAALIGH